MKATSASSSVSASGNTSRINARLDAQAAAHLEYLVSTTGLGVSEVVRESLSHYYRAQRAGGTPKLEHLAPLIGKFRSGRADTSARVKEVVARHLQDKHSFPGTKSAKSAKPEKGAR